MPTTLPPRQPPEPSNLDPGSAADGDRQRAWHGIQGTMLGISAVALLALMAMPLLFPDGGRGPLLRVAVVEPVVEAADDDTTLSDQQIRWIRHAAVDAMLRALASRQGIRATYIGGDENIDRLGDVAGDHLEAEAPALELLRLRLHCTVERCRGRLQRERPDGSASWQPMPVRFALDDLRNIDRRLSKDIKLSHMSYLEREGGARLLAAEDEYRRYLEIAIALRAEGVGARRSQFLTSLQTLRERAPRFVDAHVIAAELLTTIGPRHHAEAIELLETAHRVAPGDWRPLAALLPLLADDPARSERYAERLDRMLPGEPELDPWRSPDTPSRPEESP